MAKPLNKIDVGEVVRRFPANTWNALIEGELARRNEPGRPNLPSDSGERSSTVVSLAYEGDTDLEPGSVVILGDAVIDPSDDASEPFNDIRLKCDLADSETETTGDIAIVFGPLDAQTGSYMSMGSGVVQGMTWAKVNVTDEDHTTAGPADGEPLLQSGVANRTPIIWKQAGTGEVWALVLLGGGSSGTIAVQVTGEIDAATNGYHSITPGTGTAYKLKRVDGAWEEDEEVGQVDVENHSQTPIVGSTANPVNLRAHKIDGVWVLDPFDLWSLPNATIDDAQAVVRQTGERAFGLSADYDSGAVQFLGHDTSGDLTMLGLTEQQLIDDYDHANKEFDTLDAYVFNPHNAGTISIDTTGC